MWTPTLEGFAEQMAKDQGATVDEVRKQFETDVPLGKMPTGGDAAEAVAFLLSDRARSITGQALLVNSGEWMS